MISAVPEPTNEEKLLKRVTELHCLGYVIWNAPRVILENGCAIRDHGFYTLSESGWLLLSAAAAENPLPIRREQLRKEAS